jgi:hypothetical protein
MLVGINLLREGLDVEVSWWRFWMPTGGFPPLGDGR